MKPNRYMLTLAVLVLASGTRTVGRRADRREGNDCLLLRLTGTFGLLLLLR